MKIIEAVRTGPRDGGGWTGTITPSAKEAAKARALVRARFAPGARQPPPLSFVYNGKPSSELLPQWKRAARQETLDAARIQHRITWTDPSTGLQVMCEGLEYRDYPAVEWVIHFHNTGAHDTPILEKVQALDWAIHPPDPCKVFLHWARGSDATAADFAPVCIPLAPYVTPSFGSVGGRSSNAGNQGGAFPFFNLELADEGAMVAVGWSGQWQARFSHLPATGITIQAGMERTHLRLRPNERIRTPRILLLFWSGERLRGHNLLRGFLLRHKLPRVNGQPVTPPVAANGWTVFDWGNGTTEQNQIEFARLYRKKKIGLEYFWIDAGWFEGGWPYGVGNWFPRKDNFPRGLKPVSEAVHQMGLKFMVWFEPERVCPGTQIHREHPEWLLRSVGNPANWPSGVPEFLLFDLGHPAARRWLTEHISGMITQNGIDCYRQDFNFDPLPYWRAADADDRQGLSEIRFVEGLYAFWDELRARHPGLLIDNCASGGRRIDLETMTRSIPLWRSDHYGEPTTAQCHTYGISLYVPGSANGCDSLDPYNFRGGLSGGASLCWDVRKPEFPDAKARQLAAEARRLRPFFHGNYYPLTPYSTEPESWLAYQFDRPDLGGGMLLAFRRPKSKVAAMTFPLRGLKRGARYEVCLNGRKQIVKARDLIAGLAVRIPKPAASALVTYRSISRKGAQ